MKSLRIWCLSAKFLKDFTIFNLDIAYEPVSNRLPLKISTGYLKFKNVPMKTDSTTTITKWMMPLAGILLLISLFFPMWRIELDAPQYPEGLMLQLHANKIAGDVEIINGLNHYIGMKTLHTEDFFEFTILPYIVISFSVLAFLGFFVRTKKYLLSVFIALILFGIMAAADFYHWNYEYGLNLDPNAAIKVPGMAYQPPMIGYKQLLNFGAYSIPDIGGWLLILSGLLLSIMVWKEFQLRIPFLKTKVNSLLILRVCVLACSPKEAVPIKLNIDVCEYCKMPVADGKFGAELITTKGRVYTFDDIVCLKYYAEENQEKTPKSFFVHDYMKNNQLIEATKAYYLKGGEINSPMRGNIAAFSDEKEAKKFAEKLKAKHQNWQQIMAAQQ